MAACPSSLPSDPGEFVSLYGGGGVIDVLFGSDAVVESDPANREHDEGIVASREERLTRADYLTVSTRAIAQQAAPDLDLADALMSERCPVATALRILL